MVSAVGVCGAIVALLAAVVVMGPAPVQWSPSPIFDVLDLDMTLVTWMREQVPGQPSPELQMATVAGSTVLKVLPPAGTFDDENQLPTVLCIHGFPDNALTFREQMNDFARKGYRVVAPVLRGYEGYEGPPPPTPVTALAGDALAVVKELVGPDGQVHLVGHDWGSAAAQALSFQHPEVVASLTLIAVAPDVFPYGMSKLPSQLRNSWYMFFFQLPVLPEWWLQEMGGLDKLYRDWSPTWDHRDPDMLPAVRRTLRQQGVLAASLQYYRDNIVKPLLPNFLLGDDAREAKALLAKAAKAPLTPPVLGIVGEADGCMDHRLFDITMLDPERAHRFAGDTRVLKVPNAGHFVHQENPAAVNEAVLAWMREHPTAAEQRQAELAKAKAEAEAKAKAEAEAKAKAQAQREKEEKEAAAKRAEEAAATAMAEAQAKAKARLSAAQAQAQAKDATGN